MATPYAGEVTEIEPQTPNSNLRLLAGLLIFLAASFAALLAAGELGVGGVIIAVLIEATAIAALYRWCAA